MRVVAWVGLLLSLSHAAWAQSDELEKRLNDLIEGYIVPPFKEAEFRQALSSVKDPNLLARVYERIDRESLEVRAKLDGARGDLVKLPPLAKDATEEEKRALDVLQKRVAILEKQLGTLDLMQIGIVSSLPPEQTEETLDSLLKNFKKLSPRMKGLVLDVAARNSTPHHARILSDMFAQEREPVAQEKLLAAMSRVDRLPDPVVVQLCTIAGDVNQSRRFRRHCMKTLIHAGSPAALPYLRKLLDSEVVGSEAYDVYRNLTGIDPFVEN